MRDHARLCEGREYTCSCGYDKERDDLQNELLKALKAMLPEANRGDQHLRPSFETCEAARAAIAKAEGRS